jgi:CheY-like chemotaxis protein
MGGAIGLDSRPGEGASFWVQLPFAPATERVGTADRASVARSPAVAAQSQGTLLVVEDQAINQEVAKGILWKLGYRCDVAGDGVEALAALERRSYDAILMDCRMERMDGFQATAEIRRREAGGRRVPIIAMTASAQVADRERCIAVGMDDYLSKPVSERDLQIVLNRWVSHGDGDLAQRGGGAGAGTAPAEVDGVLDPEQLDRLRELAESSGNPVFLAGLVEKFATEAASLLVDLAATTERRDPEALRSAVHSLKGSSATMGAAAVASACDALEAAAGRGELPTPKVLARIAGELDRAFTALRAAASPTAP